ncbi:MAG: hypothetical protein MZW92_32845 [Comamonadaceae bacterium]|nr:hypothetical protein [Comamonadaceae bacterium]
MRVHRLACVIAAMGAVAATACADRGTRGLPGAHVLRLRLRPGPAGPRRPASPGPSAMASRVRGAAWRPVRRSSPDAAPTRRSA